MIKAAPHSRLWARLQPLGAILTASTMLVSAAAADHRPEPANACAAYLHAVEIGAATQEQWESRPDSVAAQDTYRRAQESRRTARADVIAKLSEHWDEPVPSLLTDLGKARDASEIAMMGSMLWLSLSGTAEKPDGQASPAFHAVNAALDSVWEAEHTMLTQLCDQGARMHQ
ncbi:MAG: hypothetical protein OXI73_03355 [Rhodospirillales bacterium]|nr:hypothetical protein [Rhodospirillales bacterium]